MIVKYLYKGHKSLTPEDYADLFAECYEQTDRYIGRFLPLLDEGWTILVVSDHADSLAMTYGEAGTSVSPIFLAAGPGIKENFVTERVIREVDVAPTVAVLGGVRMPRECEGAPVYQILAEDD